MVEQKWFPIVAGERNCPGPTRVPWEIAEKAYAVYASKYGKSQSMQRLAERGGFWPSEMDMLYPPWRDEIDVLLNLKKKIEAIRESLEKIVVPDGVDAGVILLSDESPTRYDEEAKCQVYLHENFSPLGDALVKLHQLVVSE